MSTPKTDSEYLAEAAQGYDLYHIVKLLRARDKYESVDMALKAACQVAEDFKRQLDQIRAENDALKAELASLKTAAQGMLENYIELKSFSLAVARSDAPNWIGASMTPNDDIHVQAVTKALGREGV